jgi:hypothetical protein
MTLQQFIRTATLIGDQHGKSMLYKLSRYLCIIWLIATVAVVIVQSMITGDIWYAGLGMFGMSITAGLFATWLYLTLTRGPRGALIPLGLLIAVRFTPLMPSWFQVMYYYDAALIGAMPAMCWGTLAWLCDPKVVEGLKLQEYYARLLYALKLSTIFSGLPCVAAILALLSNTPLRGATQWVYGTYAWAVGVTVIMLLAFVRRCKLRASRI